MNWYRMQKEAFNFKDLGRGLGTGVMMGLPALLSPSQRATQPPTSPIKQEIVEPNAKPLVTQTPTYPTPKIDSKYHGTAQVHINPRKIIGIESSGRSNAVSGKGAAGLMGLMPATWDEIVKKMGKNYSRADMLNGPKNVEVGNYYFNTEIPRLLQSANIPDSIEARIAAYNWGIGNLNNVYKKFGDKWLQHAPKETQDYVKKYNG